MDWENVEPSENELIANRKKGTIYCGNFSGGKYISVKTIETHTPIKEEDIALLDVSPQIQFRIAYIDAHDSVEGFRLKKIKYDSRSKKWVNDGEITLSKFTTADLAGFCEILSKISLRNISQSEVNIDELNTGNVKDLEAKLRSILATSTGRRLISTISETQSVSDTDIVNISYRKDQLEIFRLLLEERPFFDTKKKEWNCRRDEDVWQYFFEINEWIFGYGLSLISCQSFDDAKLEQTVVASTIFQPGGKRVDALLRTRGFLNSIFFAEIKKHDTPLLDKEPYRKPDGYMVSYEVSGATAQVQKTIHKTVSRLSQDSIKIKKSDGTPTGEEIFITQPKGVVIVGSLREFEENGGINNEKFFAFELYRRNLHNPEIITFDELYERAKFIVL